MHSAILPKYSKGILNKNAKISSKMGFYVFVDAILTGSPALTSLNFVKSLTSFLLTYY